MPFVTLDDIDTEEPIPGFHMKLVHTESMTFTFSKIKAGATFPQEHHPNEQMIAIIEGEMELTLGEETEILRPGKVAIILSDMPHSGRAITDCQMIEAFHPRSRRANKLGVLFERTT